MLTRLAPTLSANEFASVHEFASTIKYEELSKLINGISAIPETGLPKAVVSDVVLQ